MLLGGSINSDAGSLPAEEGSRIADYGHCVGSSTSGDGTSGDALGPLTPVLIRETENENAANRRDDGGSNSVVNLEYILFCGASVSSTCVVDSLTGFSGRTSYSDSPSIFAGCSGNGYSTFSSVGVARMDGLDGAPIRRRQAVLSPKSPPMVCQ